MITLFILILFLIGIYVLVKYFYAVISIIAFLIIVILLYPYLYDIYYLKYGSEEQKTKIRIKRSHVKEEKKKLKQLKRAEKSKHISIFNLRRKKERLYNKKKNELIESYGKITYDSIIEENNLTQEIIAFEESRIISLMGNLISYEMLLRCQLKNKQTDYTDFSDSNRNYYIKSINYYTLMVCICDINMPVINISSEDKEKIKDIESFINSIIDETKSLKD